MGFYRKKPVMIEAMKWDGSLDKYELIHMRWPMLEDSRIDRDIDTKTIYNWSIKTLEGRHLVSVGDYIIKGVKGEFYPCKPDIFKLTYEEVI